MLKWPRKRISEAGNDDNITVTYLGGLVSWTRKVGWNKVREGGEGKALGGKHHGTSRK